MQTAGKRTVFESGMTWEPAGQDWPRVRLGVIGEAWRLYRREWTTWSLTLLVAFVATAIGDSLLAGVFSVASRGMFGGLHTIGLSSGSLLPAVAGSALAGYFVGGMIRMALGQIDGRRPRVEDLFHVTDVWLDLVLASLLLGLVYYVGSLLFVIPALVAGGLLMFTYPLIVDSRLPATGAMIQSFEAVKSQWLAATVVHLGILFVAGVGIVLAGVGILITGPLYALSTAVLYREVFRGGSAFLPSKARGFDDIH